MLLYPLHPVHPFIMALLITRFVYQAGEKAVSCGVSNVSDLEELTFIKDLHLRFLPYACNFSVLIFMGIFFSMSSAYLCSGLQMSLE